MKPCELLTRKQVAAMLNVSERTIYRKVEDSLFPAPALVLGRPRWKKEDVDKYIEECFNINENSRVKSTH